MSFQTIIDMLYFIRVETAHIYSVYVYANTLPIGIEHTYRRNLLDFLSLRPCFIDERVTADGHTMNETAQMCKHSQVLIGVVFDVHSSLLLLRCWAKSC